MTVRRLDDRAASYRVAMLTRLGSDTTLGLNTEAADDFAVALVDAWAEVCAGLGFYQNHIAEEAYLDTAVEPLSVRELVRLTGYEPRPATPSTVVVAFTTRSGDLGADTNVTAGRRIQSVPGDGEEQVTFETSSDLLVRPAWSRLNPAIVGSAPFVATESTRWLSIIACRPAPRVGDRILLRARPDTKLAGAPAVLFRTVSLVERTGRGASFRLRLDAPAPHEPTIEIVDPEVFLLSLHTRPFGADAPLWSVADAKDRERVGTHRGWVMSSVHGAPWRREVTGLPKLDVLSLAIDENGNAYAGTDGAGVFQLATGADTWLAFGEGTEKAKVTALTTGREGWVFAGTHDERVLLYRPDTGKWDLLGDRVQRSRNGRKRAPERKPWPREPIRSLVSAHAFKKDLLFAGTDTGVFRWREGRGWRGLNPGLPDWDIDTARTRVNALAFDDKLLDLYAATSRGVYRSRTLGLSWHRRNAELGREGYGSPPRVTDLFIADVTNDGDGDGPQRTLFAATEHAVLRTTNGGRHWHRVGSDDMPLPLMRRLAGADDGLLVAGTSSGVQQLTGDPAVWSRLPAATPDDHNLSVDPMDDVHSLEVGPNRVLVAMPRGDYLERDWPNFWIGGPSDPNIDLPAPRGGLAVGSPLILRNRVTGDLLVTSVLETVELDRHDFGLKRPILRCRLDVAEPSGLRLRFPLRDTDIYTQSQLLSLRVERSERVEPVRGNHIQLAEGSDVPPVGRLVSISGRPARARLERLGGVLRFAVPDLNGPSHDGLAWFDVSAIACRPDGVAFAIVDGVGLLTKAPMSKWTVAEVALPSTDIRALMATASGDVVAATGHGDLWTLDPWATTWIERAPHLPHGGEWSIAAGPGDTLIAATPTEGLWVLRPADTTWTRSPLQFDQGAIRSLAVATDASVHVADATGRLHRYDPRVGRWASNDALVATEVQALAGTPDGGLLVATGAALHLRSDRGVVVDTVRPHRVCTADARLADGLNDGVLSDGLRRAIAARVTDLGELRPLETVGVTSLLIDDDTFDRYVVAVGAKELVVNRLPAPLHIDRDVAAVGAGRVRWFLRSVNGRAGTAILDDSAATFVTAATTDVVVSEIARIVDVLPGDAQGRATLVLDHSLDLAYDRSTVGLNANAIEAAAGISVPHEVLGSGDSSIPHQAFRLSYPHDPAESVFASGLVVEVLSHTDMAGLARALSPNSTAERVRWDEVPTLLSAGPTSRVYEVRHGDDGRVTVRFGDGVHGARLPTGYGNVIARYRVGSATPASVRPGQLTLLATRPKGIAGVSNPIAAAGGLRAEGPDDARVGAPRRVRAPERVVSLRDVERFSAGFDGIGHASARRADAGDRLVVHVAVASADGSPLSLDSPQLAELDRALRRSWSRPVGLVVAPAAWAFLTIEADLSVEGHHAPDVVLADAVAELMSRYRPQSAAFGRDVSAAEVMAALHALPGVVGVDLRVFNASRDRIGRDVLVRSAPDTLIAVERAGDIQVTTSRRPT